MHHSQMFAECVADARLLPSSPYQLSCPHQPTQSCQSRPPMRTGATAPTASIELQVQIQQPASLQTARRQPPSGRVLVDVAGRSPPQVIKALLKANRGLMFGDSHGNNAIPEFMAGQMGNLAAAGVKDL